MAIKRTEKPDPGQLVPALEDPAQLISELFRWNPLRELTRPAPQISFAPTFEVRETKDRFIFRADLPGVKDQDLDIDLTGNRLTVSGRRDNESVEESDTILAAERGYGTFSRWFLFPERVDPEHVQAVMKEGVLTVVVAKAPQVKPRAIPPETAGKAKA